MQRRRRRCGREDEHLGHYRWATADQELMSYAFRVARCAFRVEASRLLTRIARRLRLLPFDRVGTATRRRLTRTATRVTRNEQGDTRQSPRGHPASGRRIVRP